MHGNTYAEGTFANRNIMSQKSIHWTSCCSVIDFLDLQ